MTAGNPHRVPARMRARFDEIVALTDAFATRHLDAEYAELCRRMAAELARRRPSPLDRGMARTWAAGIVYAIGWVNFLSDPSQEPHMTTAELAAAAGVGQSTIAATFRRIREAIALVLLDPAWTRPSRLLDNPLAWMVLMDGMPVDLRDAPREIQEAAFEQGLIPFVPAPDDAAGQPSARPEEEGMAAAMPPEIASIARAGRRAARAGTAVGAWTRQGHAEGQPAPCVRRGVPRANARARGRARTVAGGTASGQ